MEKSKKEKYNAEPVFFCINCLSLRIKTIEGMLDYCDECGQTNIKTTNIEHWEDLFEQKYGYNYLEGNKNKYLNFNSNGRK